MAKTICQLSVYEECFEFCAQVLHAALTHLHIVLTQATRHTELMNLLKIIFEKTELIKNLVGKPFLKFLEIVPC